MKVAIVTNLIPDYQQTFFNKLIDLHPEVELTVFADIETNNPLNQYNSEQASFSVVQSSMKEIKGLIFRSSIFDKLTYNFDKIIIYANPREISLSLLMIKLKFKGVEFYTHGMFHRVGGQKFFSKMYYLFSATLSRKVFVYSKKGAQVLLNLNVNSNKIKIIGTAIDQNYCIAQSRSISHEEIEKFKSDNNIHGKKVVLQVVRLSKIKKPEMIIDVAKELRDYYPDVLFVLIGAGELFEYINEKVKVFNLENTVKLLGAIYDEDILAHWFNVASVFVIPTCIGLSAHHAFSYGLPIVTDDDLLNQASEFDILADGLNSVVYRKGSIEDFSNSILRIISDDEFRNFLSNNARMTVVHTHSLENKVNNYFRSLID